MINFIKKKFLFFTVVIYHFIFTIISYNYYLKNDGDASLYWFLTPSNKNKTWFDYAHFGNEAFLFINYPLVKFFGLPIFGGFLIYSFVGLIGIFQFYKLIKLWIGEKVVFFGANCIPLLLFMPNMHYWTSILGKEPLMFICIATVLIEIFKKKYFSFKTIISLFTILLIRPHLFLILLSSIGIILFLYEKWNRKKKTVLLLLCSFLLSISFILFLKISNINNFNWERIIKYNDYSLVSLKYSKSYIPMIEYCFPMKFFAFYFRPLFFDSHNVYGFFISVENLLVLTFHLIAVYLIVKYYKIIKFDLFFRIIITYGILSAIIYVQRYSDLGLIIRTKALIQPFVILALFWILNQIKIKKEALN